MRFDVNLEADPFSVNAHLLQTAMHEPVWPIAAPDVCDGTSIVGESRHRIPRRIRWSTDRLHHLRIDRVFDPQRA